MLCGQRGACREAGPGEGPGGERGRCATTIARPLQPYCMERRSETEWIKIRQRRVIDEAEYYADRLYETQRAATTYARQLQGRGDEVIVLPTVHAGGHRGYAVFVRR